MLEVAGIGMTYRPARGLLGLLVRSASDEPVRALDDVDLTVNAGEVVGIVGPNGAGKSTLLRAITTLLVPTEGSVTINGREVTPDDDAAKVSFGLSIPNERSFYWRLTGRQNLHYFAALAGLDEETATRRVEETMTERGLAHRDKAVFGYSSGMLAQLGIARATLHEPPLLVLDEPTRSIDPIAGRLLCQQIRGLAADGRAVLMASHRLDEVVLACDRVVALINGRIEWEGSAAEIAGDPAGLGAHLERLVDDAGEPDL
ncbi:MAG: ABC transporter ATP-binding protein [Acidimicrobiales bacterium]|nr:ABC transporter ATP-binding protein [Acidimicrobiales bacterium]